MWFKIKSKNELFSPHHVTKKSLNILVLMNIWESRKFQMPQVGLYIDCGEEFGSNVYAVHILGPAKTHPGVINWWWWWLTFILFPRCARHCHKCLYSCLTTTVIVGAIIFPPIYKWGNQAQKGRVTCLNLTELVSGRAMIHTLVLPHRMHMPPLCQKTNTRCLLQQCL